jgi:predicted 3-demethylubiquinone-9 3-methyltransferase (glyoxalase superfamily)
MRALGDLPTGKQGDVLTVEFIVMGSPRVDLIGGSGVKRNEAFSCQVATEEQAVAGTPSLAPSAKRACSANARTNEARHG